MPSPLLSTLTSSKVIDNSMTLGQLRLIAKCISISLMNANFHMSLSADELEEAQALVDMFDDKFLDDAPDDVHHGFCL